MSLMSLWKSRNTAATTNSGTSSSTTTTSSSTPHEDDTTTSSMSPASTTTSNSSSSISAPSSPLLVPKSPPQTPPSHSGRTTSTTPQHDDFFPFARGSSAFSGADDMFKLELFPIEEDTSPDAHLSDRRVFADFMLSHQCYDMVPASGKIVVLHTGLTVNAAFHALNENDIKSAPLWDPESNSYVGMITVTDFIDILRHYHTPQNRTLGCYPEIGENKIQVWRQILAHKQPATLYSAHPEDSIYEATRSLIQHKIHRLPVIDPSYSNSILHIVSPSRVLRFVMLNLDSKPDVLQRTIGELRIGTYTNVVTVLSDTPLIVLLNLLAERKISAVPLVDETGAVTGIYAKSDVVRLTKHANIFSKLDEPVQEFSHDVHICQKSDTLQKVVDYFMSFNVRRLVCVDSAVTRRIEGIVSLSDIMRFFLV